MKDSRHKSNSVSKADDPRVLITQEKIESAFVDLLHRRSYAGIRVGDIARKARIGRATFYAHYASKHELLDAQLRKFVLPLIVLQPRASCAFDCTALFAHIRQARVIYRSLISGTSRATTERIVQDCLERRFAADLATMGRPREGDASVVNAVAARFLAASLLTLLAWWVEQETRASPQDMQRAFESLVMGGLRGTPL